MRWAILASDGIRPSSAIFASHHAATPVPYFSRTSSMVMGSRNPLTGMPGRYGMGQGPESSGTSLRRDRTSSCDRAKKKNLTRASSWSAA